MSVGFKHVCLVGIWRHETMVTEMLKGAKGRAKVCFLVEGKQYTYNKGVYSITQF